MVVLTSVIIALGVSSASPQIEALEPELRRSISPSVLEPGDVLFMTTDQVSSKLIRFVTRGPYSHVALYVGYEGGVHWVIDATTRSNVAKRSLDECLKESKYIVAARVPTLTALQQQTIINFANKQVGKEYDYFGALASARVMVGKKSVTIRFREDSQKFYCSELLVDAFDSLGHRDFTLAVSAAGTNPNDLRAHTLSHRLTFIGLITSAGGQ